jgi:hypothetical protein
MRTTISLPDELLESAKMLASERAVTLGVVVEDALREHLARRRSARVPEFRLHTVRGNS